MPETSKCDCREAFDRLDDFLDRELTPEEMSRVRMHLETCADCAKEFDFEEKLLAQVREKLSRIDLPAELSERISRCLRESETG